jgi:hypothetical protein
MEWFVRCTVRVSRRAPRADRRAMDLDAAARRGLQLRAALRIQLESMDARAREIVEQAMEGFRRAAERDGADLEDLEGQARYSLADARHDAREAGELCGLHGRLPSDRLACSRRQARRARAAGQ